jgi:hypothetical protein
MITPDGTVLQSYHVHDYKTHLDKNGEEYMLDGGADYVRTSMNNVPAEYITVSMSDKHELRREWFSWGSYGKTGKDPLKWIKLKDMETEHILACLETCRLANHVKELFEFEIAFREGL